MHTAMAMPICALSGCVVEMTLSLTLLLFLAAVGVFGTGTIFPDLFVAFVIAYLGVSSGYAVIKQSLQERKQSKLMLGSEA